jgi:hypothetical protein
MPIDAQGRPLPYNGAAGGPAAGGPSGLADLLKKAAAGRSPTFAGSRATAAPMKSTTPVIGGKSGPRRGLAKAATPRVSRPRGGGSGRGIPGVKRRGRGSPIAGPADARASRPAQAGPSLTPNDPNSFRPPIPATPVAQSGRASLPSAPGQRPPGPMGASAAGAASPIARAAMGGAPAMPGVRRPQRPGGMLGAAQNRRG